MDTTAMITAACDGDRRLTFARLVMTIEDCIAEYAEIIKREVIQYECDRIRMAIVNKR